VIAKNSERRAKTLWTDGERGSHLRGYVGMDENDEAHFIAREIDSLHRNGRKLAEIAVFYRTNAQSRALEDALMAQAIPYRIYGGLKFYDRKEIKDILAYLKMLVNEKDDQSFQRCINTPPRGLGPKSVEVIRQKAGEQHLSLFEAAKELRGSSRALDRFLEITDSIAKMIPTESLYDVISAVIDLSGYAAKLKKMEKDVTALSRLENLDELKNIATTMSFVADSPTADLQQFLDKVSLTSSEELPKEEAQEDGEDVTPPDTVSLMTLHLAKGLEFPIVFLTGLEDGTLPHYRSLESQFELSEERRLCYVGMTRAMEHLYLSRAERRGMFSAGGNFGSSYSGRKPSRFVFDIPIESFDQDSQHFASEFGGYGALHYEYRDELTFEEVQARKAKRKKEKNGRRLQPATVLSADTLEKEGLSKEDFSKFTLAKLKDLESGTRVLHRIFGEGTVEDITDIDEQDPNRTKITVKFDAFELPKKLVYRHANLALPTT
ncbi:ATP-binding domain-containing protein, partial [bacterium]|nr:ATP-binding domain-containing protein [bacterium]